MSFWYVEKEERIGVVKWWTRVQRIRNNSVEAGTEYPDYWYFPVDKPAYWVEGVARTGKRSLLLKPVNDRCYFRCLAFEVVPNSRYELIGYVKGRAESGSFNLTARWFDADENFISQDDIPIPLGEYSDWTEFKSFFTAPSNAAKADVMFHCEYVDSTGELYCDDIMFVTEKYYPSKIIAIEALTPPYSIELNPVEVYAHALSFFYKFNQFSPTKLSLTVKPIGECLVDVYDADFERLLMQPKRLSSETTLSFDWDGKGLFDIRVMQGSVESLILDWNTEEAEMPHVERGYDWSSLAAVLLSIGGGTVAAYQMRRGK